MKRKLLIVILIILGITFKCLAAVNLIISSGTVPSTMKPGSTYAITINVTNNGTTATTTSFYINISINTAATYSGTQTWLTDITVTGGVAAGVTKTFNTNITIPATYTLGARYILSAADATSLVSESSETDNILAFPITLSSTTSSIELAPVNYSLSTNTITAGSTLTANFAASNIGSTAAGVFNVGFYLSNSTTLDTTKAINLGVYNIASLNASTTTSSLNKTLTIPASICNGTYYLFIFVDNGRVIIETNENNNTSYQTISLTSIWTPTIPSNPTSNSLQCGNVTITRVGTPVTGDTWYWQTSPSGTSQSLGSGTTYTTATSGTYYIRAYNTFGACWSSGSGSVSVALITTPTAASTISGLTTVCQGQNAVLYTVPVIANATSYIWTLPDGTIDTTATDSLSVNFANNATSGNITVKGRNACGNGVSSSLAIIVNFPQISSYDSLLNIANTYNQANYTVPSWTLFLKAKTVLANNKNNTNFVNLISVISKMKSSTMPYNIVMNLNKDPKTKMAFNWFTNTGITGGQVQIVQGTASDSTAFNSPLMTVNALCGVANNLRYCLSGNNLSTLAGIADNSTRSYTYNKALVSGLTTDTQYSYRVGKNGAWSDIGSFKTAKDAKDAFSFIYTTDHQASQVDNDFNICQLTTHAAKTMYPQANFWLNCGDIADDAAEWEFEQFFETQQDIFMNNPMVIVQGNHANDSTYHQFTNHFNTDSVSFDYKYPTKAYCPGSIYSFVYGDALFMALNFSDYGVNNDYTHFKKYLDSTAFWMSNQVKAHPDVKWRIAFFHINMYTGAGHYNNFDIDTIQNRMGPVFDSLKIDLALQGHDHIYEVIGPINNKNLVQHPFISPPTSASVSSDNINGKIGGTFNTFEGTLFFLNKNAGNKGYSPATMPSSYSNLFTGRFGQPGLPTYSYVTVATDSINISTYKVNTQGIASLYDAFKIVKTSTVANAGTISGTTTVCQGQSSITYTVPTITNATSYVWTLPTGATGTSTTNSITVNYSNTAISGNITVKGHNTFGDGVSSSLAIIVNPLPANAGTISGTTTVYQGQNSMTYTVPVITNATSYVWSLPTGAIGTSSTNSITANYSNSAVSGNISVFGVNSCGNGTSSSLAITISSTPVNLGTFSGADIATLYNNYSTVGDMQEFLFANTGGQLNLSNTASQYKTEISNFAYSTYDKLTCSGDFDGDGKDEVAMFVKIKYQPNCASGVSCPAYYRTHVVLLKSDGSYFHPIGSWYSDLDTVIDAAKIRFATSGDFDNDGKSDIAFVYSNGSNASSLMVLKSTGNSFTAPTVFFNALSTSFKMDSVMFALSGDYDGDGKSDMALIYKNNTNKNISVFTSTGTVFNAAQSYYTFPDSLIMTQIKYALSGNFTSDAKSDIALLYKSDFHSSPDSGNVILVLKAMVNSFANPKTYINLTNTISNYSKVLFATTNDFNNDGLSDIALAFDTQTGSPDVQKILLIPSHDTLFATPVSYWNTTTSTFNFTNVKHFVAGKFSYTPAIQACNWQGNKIGVLTFSFDDGYDSTIINSKYLYTKGVLGTHNIITHNVGTSNFTSWARMQADTLGNEYGSHTQTHPFLNNIPLTTVATELTGSKQELISHLSTDALSIVFPDGAFNNDILQSSALRNNYLSARTSMPGYNLSTPIDQYALFAPVVLNATDTSTVFGWINKTVNYGYWTFLMMHYIGADNGPYSNSFAKFKTIVDYACKQNLWINTQENVMKYITERNALKPVNFSIQNANTIKLNLDDGLNDIVYNVPLTIKVIIPNTCIKDSVAATQTGITKYYPVVNENGTLYSYINCLPNSTDVLITNYRNNIISNRTICQGSSVIVGTHTYTTSGTYVDSLKTSSGCDSIITTVLTVNSLTTNLGTISGTNTVCQGQSSLTYTVPVNANATTYIWTLPTGATGTSTTNSINVSYSNTAISGNIYVFGTNSCGNGITSSLAITVSSLPPSAGTISGTTTVCQGQSSLTYTVPAITNATSYIWTLPTGAIGTSTTNSITVSYGYTAVSGNITVKGHNTCGDGASSSLAVIVNLLPANAGTISGNTNVNQGQSALTYTVPAIVNSTSYVWTLPTGATGTSTTNSITVNYSTTASSGNITVKGHNTCGDGVASNLAITVNSTASNGQWVVKTSGTTSDLMSVYFPTSNIGYAAGGSGTIVKTTNAGATWTSLTSLGKWLGGIFFTDSVTGYAVGNDYSIIKTTNGSTWVTKYQNTTPPAGSTGTNVLYSVYFTDANTGYAVGLYGKILKTTDAGSTWTTLTSGTTVRLNSVCFANSTNGFIAGLSGTLLKTFNSGTSWTSTSLSTSYNLYSVNFINSTTGLAVGYDNTSASGLILRTTDGGTTWVRQTISSTIKTLYSVYFTDVNTAYISGASGVILMSTNGGTTWTTQTSNTTNTLLSIYFPNPYSGYSVGVGGKIVKYQVLPSTAGTISGFTTVTTGQSGVVYTVPAIANATSYVWTLPTGATGTSSTNSISVNYSSSAVSGNITVNGVNSNGNGIASSLAITVIPSKMNDLNNALFISKNEDLKTAKLKIFPNPSSEQTLFLFNIPKSDRIKISLFNQQGRLISIVNEEYYQAGEHTFNYNTSNLSSGIYFVKFETEKYQLHDKMIIIHK